jgi:DNA invertase Pin-like site-specific DNA recombinase
VRAIIYTRNDAEGRQLAACERYAAERGWEVTARLSDGASAGRKPRAGFTRLMDDVDAGKVDVVLTIDPARLTRSTAELNAMLDRCQAAGVSVVTADGRDLTSAEGGLIASVIARVMESEANRRSERIKAGLAARRARPARP